MRDIKFRAWNPASAEMVYFNNEKLCSDEHQRLHLAHLMAGRYGDLLMQFTGLKDVNGVDIYEGDILEQNKNCLFNDGVIINLVSFNNKDQFVSGSCSLYQAITSFDAHVIGNIHQNPELLECKK